MILEYLIAPPGSDQDTNQAEAHDLIRAAVENGNFQLVVIYPNGTEYPITPDQGSFKSWDVEYAEDCEYFINIIISLLGESPLNYSHPVRRVAVFSITYSIYT